MFDDLSKLIAAMQNQYNYICNIWKTKTQTPINLKKKLVSDIKKRQQHVEQHKDVSNVY